MGSERIRQLAQDPRFIEGIYNHCDRWCERCPFTTRCLNYALGEEQRADPESHDLNSVAFWRGLHAIFQATFDLLKELAEQKGIDLNALDVDATVEGRRHFREDAQNHELSRVAATYAQMVDRWFESASGLFEDKQTELNLKLRLGIQQDGPLEEAASIEDAAQVVRWYQHQIYVKLMRALEGAAEERPPMMAGFPRDSDGSAKVALIAMDRSIGAWGVLRNHFPEQTDPILDMLVHLSRLRSKTEEAFPIARAFIRPGFDEAPT